MSQGKKHYCLGQTGLYRLTRWLEEYQSTIESVGWTQTYTALAATTELNIAVNTNHIKSCNASLDTPIVWPKSKKAKAQPVSGSDVDKTMMIGVLADIGTLAQAVETGLYWDGPTPPCGDKRAIQQIRDRCRLLADSLQKQK